jgi:serine/threonine protein kinase
VIGGRYTLDREIGRGGMGAVWLGRDEVLGREVALKKVGLAPGDTNPDLARAEREAKLAARLNHPHVVAVFDLVDDAHEQWLVMEHVEGTNLAALVRRDGPLPVDRAANLISQAAEALAEAHAAGIVHRDVKPSNILVTPSGQVKLTDFGIARAETDPSLTRTGLVTGSPAYLAPEVASGRMATAASDVWSLGATLYHALEGKPPYEVGDNLMGTMYRIVNEEPPRPTNAGWLEPLIRATMAKRPEDRWTMRQVHEFLAHGQQAGWQPVEDATVLASLEPAIVQTSVFTAPPGPPLPTHVEPRRRARRPSVLAPVLAVAGIIVVVVVVLAAALYLDNQRGDPPGVAADPSSRSAPSSKEPSASATPRQDAARARAMSSFVTTYLTTVVEDPKEAWEMLTPAFQEASGGFGQYNKFWKDFETADVIDIGADPTTGVVSYTVEYTKKDGGGFEDVVKLQLEDFDGSFLIAGEA